MQALDYCYRMTPVTGKPRFWIFPTLTSLFQGTPMDFNSVWNWEISNGARRNTYINNGLGLYQKGSQYIYVNRGYGFIGMPGRIGMAPEITIFELETSLASPKP